MTPSITRLKRLAEAATPGPWTATNDGSIAFGEVKQNTRSLVRIAKGGGWLFETCDPEFKRKADQKFIAAANPEAVLGLIARIEKLEAALSFYAEIGTYGTAGPGDCTSVDSSDCESVFINGWGESYRPGKRAREALKEET